MRLEQAKRRALMIAAGLAPAPDTDEGKYWAMIGLGYAIARGWITYRGQDHETGSYGFAITQAGIRELYLEDEDGVGDEIVVAHVHGQAMILLPDLTQANG